VFTELQFLAFDAVVDEAVHDSPSERGVRHVFTEVSNIPINVASSIRQLREETGGSNSHVLIGDK